MDSTVYIEASCKIYFTPGHFCCAFCPMMGEYPREHCNRTGEYLTSPKVTTGFWCPLEIQGPDISRKEDDDNEPEL